MTQSFPTRRSSDLNGDRYEQVSFYVIPIQFTKQEGRLLADFTGERRGFGISTFGPTMYDDAAPAFVRLDAYDSPGEPDEASLRKLLVREYPDRSEEHTSELQSLMRISYAVFCLKKKKNTPQHTNSIKTTT